MSAITPLSPAINASQPVPLAPSSSSQGGISFGDLIDAINPLQHIPIISSLVRAATGTHISTMSQIAGDTLFGGLVGGAIGGFASSLADVVVKQATGKNIGEHVVATLTDSSSPGAPASTPLVPTAASTPAVFAAASAANDPLHTALSGLLHSPHDHRSTQAQYARVQAFDSINRKLLKMVV